MRVLALTAPLTLLGILLPGQFASGIETPTTVLDHPSATRVVKLEFGLRSAEPVQWTGSASVSPGKIHCAWGWHFNRPDRIIGSSGWNLETRPARLPDAGYSLRDPLPQGITVLPNGVLLSVEAVPSATLSVHTNRGNIQFTLSDLDAKGRLEFHDGDVAAVAAPPVRALTRGEATQHDLPATVHTRDGLFVAWTAFHNEANVVYLAWRKDDVWQTRRVTPEWGDYSGTAVAAGPDGRVHVIWSEYADDRWRLVDRALDPRTDSWGDDVYVSPSGRRQYFPVAATARNGKPWVVWQEFRGQGLDIMAARHEEGSWTEAVRVSESAANDWAPDIAAAPDGSVWVAWDSYERGNYGIYVRRLHDRGVDPVLELPPDPNRAIEPSIAVDGRNRVWVAWAETGPNWGKDWGVLGRPATSIRSSSNIRLARFAEGSWSEPATSLEDSVPGWMAEMHEYPSLFIGDGDVPYIFFRRMLLRHPVAEHELRVKFGADERILQPWYDTIRGLSRIQLTAFNGSDWLPVRDVPLSAAGAYAGLALARVDGGADVVWPADGRTYEDPHVRTSQIRYARYRLDAEYVEQEKLRPLKRGGDDFEDAAPTEALDLARVRSARWREKEPLQLYRGDLHRHSDLSADSQNDGDVLLQYRYALDAGALDFVAVTDHSGAERLHYYQYQWWRTRQIATMFNQPGRFATFFGYERTVTFPGGHRNVISTRREMQPVPISDEEFTGNESWAERLYPSLLRHGDIAIAHTTAGGGGTDWRDNDPRAEPVVEVFQALRGSYEEPNSPAKAGTNQPAGFVWNAWKKGWRIGLLSNSDHESTHQSYACVWAPELTNTGILDAIKQRRTYAATDNIVLYFEARRAGRSTVKMGGEMDAVGSPEFSIQVLGTAPVSSLEIIRSGEVVYSSAPGSAEVSVSFRDETAPTSGSAHYYVRIVQVNRQIVWSSPIWVDYRSTD